MKIFKYICYFIFFLLFANNLNAKIEIIYKVNNEIITNIDIENEKNYLIFLRPSLNKIPNKELTNLAKNSLIREIIKKKELDRVFNKKIDSKFINEIKSNLLKFKKVKNEKEFKELLKKNKINYEKIIEKMKYEALWNELIYRKYNSSVKINKQKLRNSLEIKLLNNKKYELNLSEILFELDAGEDFENKYNKIKLYINNNDFKTAAIKYSIANSSTKGGEIGWIKETLLSPEILKILNKKEIGSITRPIKYPNGYLLLKINEKKEMKLKIDKEKELSDLIKFEKNKQLNQFSLLLYKKLKQNMVINEF
tara:strand:- start:474 stop:1400 length:927 start_codon:yes stop_codon:yes gene_type:complete